MTCCFLFSKSKKSCSFFWLVENDVYHSLRILLYSFFLWNRKEFLLGRVGMLLATLTWLLTSLCLGYSALQLGKMAKSLFIFLFFSFSFGLTIQERSTEEYYITSVICHISGSYRVMSHNKSCNECGKIVHRPYSSCISNIQEIEKDYYKRLLTCLWLVL